MQYGIVNTAKKLGYELVEVDYKLDLGKGCDTIDSFVNMKVDCIILWSYDYDAYNTSLQRAANAGIPVITVDGEVNLPVNSFVTSDNHLGGLLAGEYAGKVLDGKGKVLSSARCRACPL